MDEIWKRAAAARLACCCCKPCATCQDRPQALSLPRRTQKKWAVRCRARARLIVFKWTVGRFNYRAGSDSLTMLMTGSSMSYIHPRASGMKGRRRSRNIPMKNRNDSSDDFYVTAMTKVSAHETSPGTSGDIWCIRANSIAANRLRLWIM